MTSSVKLLAWRAVLLGMGTSAFLLMSDTASAVAVIKVLRTDVAMEVSRLIVVKSLN